MMTAGGRRAACRPAPSPAWRDPGVAPGRRLVALPARGRRSLVPSRLRARRRGWRRRLTGDPRASSSHAAPSGSLADPSANPTRQPPVLAWHGEPMEPASELRKPIGLPGTRAPRWPQDRRVRLAKPRGGGPCLALPARAARPPPLAAWGVRAYRPWPLAVEPVPRPRSGGEGGAAVGTKPAYAGDREWWRRNGRHRAGRARRRPDAVTCTREDSAPSR
jgi:hypothetical protein